MGKNWHYPVTSKIVLPLLAYTLKNSGTYISRALLYARVNIAGSG